jgi:hypothetical protein
MIGRKRNCYFKSESLLERKEVKGVNFRKRKLLPFGKKIGERLDFWEEKTSACVIPRWSECNPRVQELSNF